MAIGAVKEEFGESATVDEDIAARHGFLPVPQPLDADAGQIEMLRITGLVKTYLELDRAHASPPCSRRAAASIDFW